MAERANSNGKVIWRLGEIKGFEINTGSKRGIQRGEAHAVRWCRRMTTSTSFPTKRGNIHWHNFILCQIHTKHTHTDKSRTRISSFNEINLEWGECSLCGIQIYMCRKYNISMSAFARKPKSLFWSSKAPHQVAFCCLMFKLSLLSSHQTLRDFKSLKVLAALHSVFFPYAIIAKVPENTHTHTHTHSLLDDRKRSVRKLSHFENPPYRKTTNHHRTMRE